jgi:serine/threonine protein kinase
LPDTVRIVNDLLAGLQFSHEQGVMHRDIKGLPNVMFGRPALVKTVYPFAFISGSE